MKILVNKFAGMIPRIESYRLPLGTAQYARNCRFQDGEVKPLRDKKKVADISLNNPLSIFRHEGRWFAFDHQTRIITNPVAQDPYKRFYYTDNEGAKMVAYENGQWNTYPLGVPKPETPPDCVTVEKSWDNFHLVWKCHYEEPSGERADVQNISNVTEITYLEEYRITGKPPRMSASSDAIFIPFVEIFLDDELQGILFPEESGFSNFYPFEANGLRFRANITTDGDDVIFKITKDDSSIEDYLEVRVYVYTYVSKFGEEGPPSDPSAEIRVLPTQNVRLTSMAAPPAEYPHITKRRIYRSAAVGNVTGYFLVKEEEVVGSSTLDDVPGGDLSDKLETTDWDPPPDGLKNLILTAGGWAAGYKERSVYLSIPYQIHAWPSIYRLDFEDDIIGIGHAQGYLYVFTQQGAFICHASDPSSVYIEDIEGVPLPAFEGSVEAALGGVVYPSEEGLIAVAPTGWQILTEPFYTKEQWRALPYASFQVISIPKELILWADTETEALLFGFHGGTNNLSVIDLQASALWYDRKEGNLYLASGTEIFEWEAERCRELTWRSGDFVHQ
ncbi:MAG: hypothetical protein DRO01_06995, partial [Thermoproteota archaeon]